MIVLSIDIQKGITDNRLYACESFIKNVTRIISVARQNNIEVIHVKHDDGPGSGFSDGDEAFEIDDRVAPHPGEKVFVKTINSCFGNRELTEYLKDKEEGTLVIVGLMTNFCIDASVKSAFERGYKVIIPELTNSTFDNEYMNRERTYKYYNDMMWPERFAQCISMEETIALMESR